MRWLQVVEMTKQANTKRLGFRFLVIGTVVMAAMAAAVIIPSVLVAQGGPPVPPPSESVPGTEGGPPPSSILPNPSKATDPAQRIREDARELERSGIIQYETADRTTIQVASKTIKLPPDARLAGEVAEVISCQASCLKLPAWEIWMGKSIFWVSSVDGAIDTSAAAPGEEHLADFVVEALRGN
jgi:hypothetical protein